MANQGTLPEITPATRQFIIVMRLLTVLYGALAALFLTRPDLLLKVINFGPRLAGVYEEIPLPQEHFWTVLSAAYVAMLALCSLYSSIFPRLVGYVILQVAAKTLSAAAFFYLFLQQRPYFAYLLGGIADSLIATIVLGFFIRSLASTAAAAHQAAAKAPEAAMVSEQPKAAPESPAPNGSSPHSPEPR